MDQSTPAAVGAGKELAGRYKIIEELGVGATSVVFRALDLRLGQEIAVKVPHLHLYGDIRTALRAENEVALARDLSHPHIVRIFGIERCAVDETANDTLLLTMELVEGGTLRAAIQEGPFDAERATGILKCLLSALIHAHGHGVVHRDIKPQNIILAADDWPKLLDFGVSALSGWARETNYRSASLSCTLEYAPPEVLRGGTSGPEADIFSLGAVAYEMLCGESLYAVGFDHSTYSWSEARIRAAVAALRVPTRLKAALDSMLTLDAGRRASASEATEMLEAGEPQSFPFLRSTRRMARALIVFTVLAGVLLASSATAPYVVASLLSVPYRPFPIWLLERGVTRLARDVSMLQWLAEHDFRRALDVYLASGRDGELLRSNDQARVDFLNRTLENGDEEHAIFAQKQVSKVDALPDGRTILEHAVRLHRRRFIAEVLESLEEPPEINHDVLNDLVIRATDPDALSTVQLLVRAGVSFNPPVHGAAFPIHFAAAGCSSQTAEMLRLVVNSRGIDLHRRVDHGSPIHIAIATKEPRCVRPFIDAGLDVHEPAVNGVSAISSALIYGTPEVLAEIMASPTFDPLRAEHDGESPLAHAVVSGRDTAVIERYLRELQLRKIRLTDPALRASAAVRWLIVHDRAVPLELLLRAEPELAFTPHMGEPPLAAAVSHRSHASIRVLAKFLNGRCEASVNGQTPLHRAVSDDRLNVLEAMLADRVCDLNEPTDAGVTPLMIAAFGNHSKAVRLLLAHGADWRYRNENGSTALAAAIIARSHEALRALIESGVDPESTIYNGRRPLSAAITAVDRHAVQILVEHGARLDCGSQLGIQPVLAAAAQQNPVSALSLAREVPGFDPNCMVAFAGVPLVELALRSKQAAAAAALIGMGGRCPAVVRMRGIARRLAIPREVLAIVQAFCAATSAELTAAIAWYGETLDVVVRPVPAAAEHRGVAAAGG